MLTCLSFILWLFLCLSISSSLSLSLSAVLKSKVGEWRKKYTAQNPTQSLPNMAVNLPLMFTACMTMPGWSAAKRQQTWSLMLFRLSHGARSSSYAKYCPTTFRLPPAESKYWDLDGLPKWLCIKYENWKGKKPDEPSRWLYVYRNVYSANLCPVRNIFFEFAPFLEPDK